MFSQIIFQHTKYDLYHNTTIEGPDYYSLTFKDLQESLRIGAVGCAGSGNPRQKKVALGMENIGELPQSDLSSKNRRSSDFSFLPQTDSPPPALTLTTFTNSLKPHLYFILGDFIYENGIPFEKAIPEILTVIRKSVFEIYGKINRPFFLIGGNHDAGLHNTYGLSYNCNNFENARDKLDATVKAFELINSSFYLIKDLQSQPPKKILIEHVGDYHNALKFLELNPEVHPEINTLFIDSCNKLVQKKNKVDEFDLNIEFVQKFYQWAKKTLPSDYIKLYRDDYSSQFFFPKRNYWLKVYNANYRHTQTTPPEGNFLCIDSSLLPVEMFGGRDLAAQEKKPSYLNPGLRHWISAVFAKLGTESWALISHHYFWSLGKRITETQDGKQKYFSKENGTQNQLLYKTLLQLNAPFATLKLTLSAHDHLAAIIAQSHLPTKNPAHVQVISVISAVGGSNNHAAYFMPPGTCYIADKNMLGFHIITLPQQLFPAAMNPSESNQNSMVEFVDCSDIPLNSHSEKVSSEIFIKDRFIFSPEGYWLNFSNIPENFSKSLFYREENSRSLEHFQPKKAEKRIHYNQGINTVREFLIYCLIQNNLKLLRFFIFGLTNVGEDFEQQKLDKQKLENFIDYFFPKKIPDILPPPTAPLASFQADSTDNIESILENLQELISAFVTVDKTPDLDHSFAQICLIYNILWQVYQVMEFKKCSQETAISEILHRAYLSRTASSTQHSSSPIEDRMTPVIPGDNLTSYLSSPMQNEVTDVDSIAFIHSDSESEEETALQLAPLSSLKKTVMPIKSMKSPANNSIPIHITLDDETLAASITLKPDYQKALRYACLKACQDYMIQFFGIERFPEIFTNLSEFPQVTRALLLISLLDDISFSAIYVLFRASEKDILLSQFLVKEILIHHINIFTNFNTSNQLLDKFISTADPKQREQLAKEYLLKSIIETQGRIKHDNLDSLEKLFSVESVSQLSNTPEIKAYLFEKIGIENNDDEIELIFIIKTIENKLKELRRPIIPHWSTKFFSYMDCIFPAAEKDTYMNHDDVDVFLRLFFESADKNSFILNIQNRFPPLLNTNTVMVGTQLFFEPPPAQKVEKGLLLNAAYQNDPIANLLFKFITNLKPESYQVLKETLVRSQSVLRLCPQAGTIADTHPVRKGYNTF